MAGTMSSAASRCLLHDFINSTNIDFALDHCQTGSKKEIQCGYRGSCCQLAFQRRLTIGWGMVIVNQQGDYFASGAFLQLNRAVDFTDEHHAVPDPQCQSRRRLILAQVSMNSCLHFRRPIRKIRLRFRQVINTCASKRPLTTRQ